MPISIIITTFTFVLNMRLMRRLLLFVAAALVFSGCVGSRVVERGEYVDEVVIHEGVSARYEIASSLPVDYAENFMQYYQ